MKNRKLPSGVIQLPVAYQTRAATKKKIKGLCEVPDNVAFFPFERLSREKKMKFHSPALYVYRIYLFAR